MTMFKFIMHGRLVHGDSPGAYIFSVLIFCWCDFTEIMMMHSPSHAHGETISPMALGSPQSPASPSSHGQHQYLPAFLMGEPAPSITSPNSSRLWSASAGSPPRSTPRGAHWAGAGVAGPTPGPIPQTLFAQSPRTDYRGPGKEKAGAPPVQGLLESIQQATPSSGMKQQQSHLDLSHSGSFRQTVTGYTPTPAGLHTPMSPPNTSTAYSHHRKTPPSPAQMDPFYTQGESLKADDELNETWVTCFGFPPAATSYILQQFSQYGTIVKHVIAADGNWMHIHYQSKFQAKKALSKNGRVFGGSIMVGVAPCIDKAVMASDKENTDTTYRSSFIGTPTQSQLLHQSTSDKLNTSRNTPIRPLTAAYKAATSDHEVTGKTNTPQKNTGLISKTMEYVFGW